MHRRPAARIGARPAVAVALALVLGPGAAGCGPEALAPDGGERLDRAALMVPETCAGCHPEQYGQWSGSMHAYAAEDPVFRAMNARGQRETGGALGDFCVQCHAPVAVREGLTTDGLDLDRVPRHLRGVTCWFCHQVEAVEGTHNNPLALADDDVMRGGIADPMDPGAHGAAWSPLHDRRHPDSAALCGSCHDIVTPAGVHLERTFSEWQASLFADAHGGRPLTCGGCHMEGSEGPAAEIPGAPVRTVHDHALPGVDVALTPFPETGAQRAAIQAFLEDTLLSQLCVTPSGTGARVTVVLDNAGAGHAFPSGAAQDRRAWVTLTAEADGTVFRRSGDVPEGTAVTAAPDPDLWLMRDRALGEDGEEAHMFWDVREVESALLPPAVTADPRDPAYDHSVRREYRLEQVPDRVEVQVSVRPLGLEVVDDLVASGDLEAEVRGRLPTFRLEATRRVWRIADGFGCVPPG